MKVGFQELIKNASCRAFNGILGECADLLETRMPLFEVWKNSWNVISCKIEVLEGVVRYSGLNINVHAARTGDELDLRTEEFLVLYPLDSEVNQVIAEMFNKRIMHVPIKERGCYDYATKEWGGK